MNTTRGLILTVALGTSMILFGGGCHRDGKLKTYRLAGHGLVCKYDAQRDRVVQFGPVRRPRKNMLYIHSLDEEPNPGGLYTFYGGMYTWVTTGDDAPDLMGAADGNVASDDMARRRSPDPAIDRGPTYVHRLSLTSLEADGPIASSGLRESKFIELREDGEAVFRHTLINEADEAQPASIRVITAVRPGSYIAVPRARYADIRFGDGGDEAGRGDTGAAATAASEEWEKTVREDGEWLVIPTDRYDWWTGRRPAIWAQIPADPVIAIYRGGYWLLRVGAPNDPDGSLWDRGEGPVEVYLDFSVDLFQAELLSPVVELAPGEATDFVERWFLIRSDSPDTAKLDEAMARLRSEGQRAPMRDIDGDGVDEPGAPALRPVQPATTPPTPMIDEDEADDGRGEDGDAPPLELDEPDDAPLMPIKPSGQPGRRSGGGGGSDGDGNGAN